MKRIFVHDYSYKHYSLRKRVRKLVKAGKAKLISKEHKGRYYLVPSELRFKRG